jgi:hypothetical protein
LQALDQQLSDMSGWHNRFTWTDEALHTDPTWDHVRSLAREVLAAFGWTDDAPPSYAAEFVPGRKSE